MNGVEYLIKKIKEQAQEPDVISLIKKIKEQAQEPDVISGEIHCGLCEECGAQLPPEDPEKRGRKHKYCPACARKARSRSAAGCYRRSIAKETPEEREARLRYKRAYDRRRNHERSELVRKAKAMEAGELVPVVHCGECRWYRRATGSYLSKCNHPSGYVGEGMGSLFFCCMGEKRTETGG